ncbi:MAG: ABC transporter ATP-binding protein/permease [Lachnospiraceae bacterium]|jgi:ATP-binding cassette subfamily B protein|nr:ABC transporter ATP-binding protein/permease [Lachnospiraceae bacterium]
MNEMRAERLRKKYALRQDMKLQHRGPGGPGPRGPRGMMPGAKPQNVKKSLGRLWGYLSQDAWKLVIVFLCVIISTVSMLAASYLLRPVINDLMAGAGAGALLRGIITMAVIYLFGMVAQYFQQLIMIGVAQKALLQLRNDLFASIQKLPLRFFDTNNHGDIMSRFTNDVDAVGEMMNGTVVQLISATINIVGTLILMIYTNLILTAITILMVPLMMLGAQGVAKRSRKFYKGQQAALGTLNGFMEETVTGQKVVKVFCHEETAKEEFDFLNKDLREKQVKAQFFGGLMGPVVGNISQIGYALTATIGGILCVTNGFDFGGLTIFLGYSRQFSRPLNELSMQVNTIFSALAGAERVFDVMDRDPEPIDAPDAIPLEQKEVTGAVTLNHVTFGYDPDKVILSDVSLYAKPGQKIALVGSTGAGKTTITNLITRFYDIAQGEITIDGTDIRNIRRGDLRKNIAIVLQDTHLFTGTVKENIRYGRLDATDAEVEKAARTASAHSFIMRLEHGYDTLIEGDGANLSQGQRQLLNIARAAISTAPILILDEATSSVDTRTEKHIERGMDRLMESRTTLVIAHRLSTVRNANAIIVLEHGEVMERGSHEELLAAKGRYYSLYTGLAQLD